MKLRGFSHHVLPNAGVPTVCKAENRLLVVQDEEHLHEMPLLAQVVDEVIHMRKHSQAFRLRVCILLLIENWTSKKVTSGEGQSGSCQFVYRWQN